MPTRDQIRGFRLISAALAAAFLLLGAAAPSRAHIIPVADLIRGITVTQAQCAALPQAVWINVMGREFCMRYYLSSAGGEGTRPAVFLQGDRLGKLNLRTGEYTSSGRDKDLDINDFVRAAEVLSRQTKGPAIYLARPGLDGSSGDHRIRHSVLELNVTNAALDAIKKRHGFDGFHLIGQSGGSMLVGGMLALRSDVGCAVIGSGRLANDRPARPSPDPATEYFNVADGVSEIARKRATRILVVTDPLDKKVPEPTQTNFVRMLRQAGGQADQILVEAMDDDRHGVVAYSRTSAAGCIRGASTQEIARELYVQIQKRLAAKAATQAQTTAAAATSAGSPASTAGSALTAR
jgi:pimeloyl-ACP methyl ester carboxylesterase